MESVKSETANQKKRVIVVDRQQNTQNRDVELIQTQIF